MDEQFQKMVAELEAKNQWRGGLSDAERTCLELGWDAAKEYCAQIADAVAEREMDENLVGGITTNGITAREIATRIRASKSVAVDNILPDSDATE